MTQEQSQIKENFLGEDEKKKVKRRLILADEFKLHIQKIIMNH